MTREREVATRGQKGKRIERSADAFVEWNRISVPLVNLHLDLDNPRHLPAASEDEAIGLLYGSEKVEALAADIAEKRAMSPFDVIGVIEMDGNPGHFVAVEGNRRLCSLLLLNDPDRAPSPAARKLMAELSKKVQLPDAIDVVRFASRDDAKHWIGIRHLGPQDGQGLVSWDTAQKSRALDDGGPDALAVAVLDRARDGNWFGDAKPPSVTTLTRYLKNREVRAALGLGHHKELVFTHDPAEVDAALRQFMLDAMPTGKDSKPLVNSRSKDEDRAVYAREFRDRGASPRTLLEKPTVPAPAAPTRATPGKRGERNKPDPWKRKFLVPAGFVCNPADRNLRMMLKEWQRTPIDDHEFANTYLLRAFIERVMTLYLATVEPGYQAPNDQALVSRCSANLDPTGRASKFKPIRVAASSQDSSHSLHTLGAAVHAGVLKDRRALISAWENWDHALRKMLEAIPTK